MWTRRLLGAGGGLVAAWGGVSFLDNDGALAAGIFQRAIMPSLRYLDAETAHRIGVLSARFGMMPSQWREDSVVLRTKLWGKSVCNPVGLAAGFDKDGEAIDGLFRVGFGIVEVGSITPLAQPGNPKPRVFRLLEDRAVINRYGFNSCGHAHAASHIEASAHVKQHKDNRLLGINLGKNKLSTDAAADYVEGVRALGRYADYLVVNVSSPNTPGLRSLQQKEELSHLLRTVRTAVDALDSPRPPLVLKIAPDLTKTQRADIAAVALSEGVDGLIISNTTVSREGLKSAAKDEEGGLSGAPLFETSTQVLADMYKRTGGKIPIIGAGGVSSGKEAYAKIRAGASAVQVYTALVYEGPPLVARIKRELADLLVADGFQSAEEAVGAAHWQPPSTK